MLSGNPIESLQFLHLFPNLRVLVLENCGIADPSIIDPVLTERVQVLDLSGNKIRGLHLLQDFPNLVELNMSRNKLQRRSEELATFKLMKLRRAKFESTGVNLVRLLVQLEKNRHPLAELEVDNLVFDTNILAVQLSGQEDLIKTIGGKVLKLQFVNLPQNTFVKVISLRKTGIETVAQYDFLSDCDKNQPIVVKLDAE